VEIWKPIARTKYLASSADPIYGIFSRAGVLLIRGMTSGYKSLLIWEMTFRAMFLLNIGIFPHTARLMSSWLRNVYTAITLATWGMFLKVNILPMVLRAMGVPICKIVCSVLCLIHFPQP
jgi:hypothetical protein